MSNSMATIIILIKDDGFGESELQIEALGFGLAASLANTATEGLKNFVAQRREFEPRTGVSELGRCGENAEPASGSAV